MWGFLGVILLGIAIHSFIYYPAMAWMIGRVSPRRYIGGGVTAIVTPVDELEPGDDAGHAAHARVDGRVDGIGAHVRVGTNLNNDGITLYEAMARCSSRRRSATSSRSPTRW